MNGSLRYILVFIAFLIAGPVQSGGDDRTDEQMSVEQSQEDKEIIDDLDILENLDLLKDLDTIKYFPFLAKISEEEEEQ